MISLIISACIFSDPSACRTFRMPLSEQIEMRTCSTNVIPLLPQWADEHPGWRITKWSCNSGVFADL